MEEHGRAIFNGKIRGNAEGEWTYIRERKESVIDYVLGDRRTREKIERIEVETKVDSDHQLVTAWVEGWRTILVKGRGERAEVGEEIGRRRAGKNLNI